MPYFFDNDINTLNTYAVEAWAREKQVAHFNKLDALTRKLFDRVFKKIQHVNPDVLILCIGSADVASQQKPERLVKSLDSEGKRYFILNIDPAFSLVSERSHESDPTVGYLASVLNTEHELYRNSSVTVAETVKSNAYDYFKNELQNFLDDPNKTVIAISYVRPNYLFFKPLLECKGSIHFVMSYKQDSPACKLLKGFFNLDEKVQLEIMRSILQCFANSDITAQLTSVVLQEPKLMDTVRNLERYIVYYRSIDCLEYDTKTWDAQHADKQPQQGNTAATTTSAHTSNHETLGNQHPSSNTTQDIVISKSATSSSTSSATSSTHTSATFNACLPPPSNITYNQQTHAILAEDFFYEYANSSGAAKRKAWRLAITEWLQHTNDRKNTQYVAEKAPGNSYIGANYFRFIQHNPAVTTTSLLQGYAALLAILNYFLANQAKPLHKQSFPWDQNKRLDDFIELLLKLQTTQTQEQLQNYLVTTGVEKGFVAKSIPIPVVGQGLSYFHPPTQEYQDLRLDLVECVKTGSTTSQDLTTAAKWLLKAMNDYASTDKKSLEHWMVERHKTIIELVLPSYKF